MAKKNVNQKKIRDKIKGNPSLDPIQEIIEKYKIDTNIWYVEHFKIKDGKWNTAAKKREQELEWTREVGEDGNPLQIMVGKSKHYPEFMMAENKTYSIEITFKRIPIEVNLMDAFKELMKDMPVFDYPRTRPMFKPGSGIALEISVLDAHFQKLAWELETGYRNYDLNITSEDYTYVIDKLLMWALPYEPEQVFYIIGQDILHVDNMASKTTSGEHTMDVDGRITKAFNKVFEITVQSIIKARKLAPVKIIWSPGNHDYLTSYMLCFAINQYFRDDKHVSVDLGFNPKKAVLWGTLLIGFTHRIVGKHNTWANELAQAFPKLWAESVFREWHHGDQHKKQDVKTIPTYTRGGVLMRQLTALSPVDRWHTDNVYTDAVPGGEAFLWSKTEGVFANFVAWLGQYENNRNKLIKLTK